MNTKNDGVYLSKGSHWVIQTSYSKQ